MVASNRNFGKKNYFIRQWWWYLPMFFVIWGGGLIFIVFYFMVYKQWNNTNTSVLPSATKVFLVITGIIISLGWIFGSYNLITYVILGNSLRRYLTIKQLQMVQSVIVPKNLKVILLVPTKNDFMENTLSQTINGQIYKFTKVFILDDSTDKKFIKRIDSFVKLNKGKTDIEIIRRNSNYLGKVGNFNHFFSTCKEDYHFAAMIDADEILPPNFVYHNLKIFLAKGNEKIGLVQSTLSTYKRESFFYNANRFGGADVGTSNNIIQNKIFIPKWCGHASLISKECVNAIGNKMTDVMSDMYGLNLEILKAGYRIFTSNLVPTGSCDPLDFNAFRKTIIRSLYLLYQYASKKTWKICFSKNIRNSTKIYLLYTMFSDLLSAIMPFLTLVNNAILFGLGYHSNSVVIYTIITLVLSLAGYMNAIILPLFRMSFWNYIRFLFIFSLAGTCLFWQKIESFFLYFIFHKRNIYFFVTPKYDRNWNIWQAIWCNRRELICMIVMMSLAIILYLFVIKDHSQAKGIISFIHIPNFLLPFISIAITQFLTIPLTLISNIKSKNNFFNQKNINIDVLYPYTKLKQKYGLY